MKENRKTNKHIVYPKELSGYVLITLVLFMIPAILAYEGINNLLFESINAIESFMVAFLISIMFLPAAYFIITLYLLLSRKIYLDADETNLKIRKAFKVHTFKIANIVSIEEKSEYRNPFTKIIISIKDNANENHNTIIKFPTIWFSDNDLRNLINYLISKNRSIRYNTY